MSETNNLELSKHQFDLIEINEELSLQQLSEQCKVMLIFLRHLGCVFCREALEDISKARKELESRDVQLVFVYMEEQSVGQDFLNRFGLGECYHISDPSCSLYAQFGLVKARLGQLMGFQTLIRGVKKGIELSQFGGRAFGDAFQMPGIFIIEKGKIIAEFVHEDVFDRPDYVDLVECCSA